MCYRQRQNRRIGLLILEVNKLGPIEDRSRCLIARYEIAIKQLQNQERCQLAKSNRMPS